MKKTLIIILITLLTTISLITHNSKDINQEQTTNLIVTTGQNKVYDINGNIINRTKTNDYYGQDADYNHLNFSFTLNTNGTTYDNNTNLTWITSPASGKMTYQEALEYAKNFEFAGYTDWRLPTVKELFSISDFEQGWPYIDQNYFLFNEGSTSSSKSDGQFWTNNYSYVDDSRLNNIAFGVNHATGHIKAYKASSSGVGAKYVRLVRGEEAYINNFQDNQDQTITDLTTNLMWMQDDLNVYVEWEEALTIAQNYEFAGHTDWRLPTVKELQNIVDYSGVYPAIDQTYFNISYNEKNENYYFWTSTSAYFSKSSPSYDSAWYVAFGYTSHGAGSVRFSPKYEESTALREGGDNILNSIRLVRNI